MSLLTILTHLGCLAAGGIVGLLVGRKNPSIAAAAAAVASAAEADVKKL